MIGYYVQGNNVIVATTMISVEALLLFKSLGYQVKFIC